MAIEKGHGQISKMHTGAEEALVHALFGDRHSAAFAYKKTQRLAAGVYLVTRSIPESDSLRGQLRTRAIGLLENMCTLARGGSNRAVEGLREEISADILAISSLLEIASISGAISHMNANILLREYAALDRVLVSREDDIAGSGAFAADELFDLSDWSARVAGPAPDAADAEPTPTTSNDMAIKDKKTFKKTKGHQKGQSNTTHQAQQKANQKDTNTQQYSGGNTRQDIICNIARKKGKINVKDISSVIVDCSEKTLQRELATLVQNGTLTKRGERRWSTYELA